jgi:ParB/RepB/Spo0J family partition protein
VAFPHPVFPARPRRAEKEQAPRVVTPECSRLFFAGSTAAKPTPTRPSRQGEVDVSGARAVSDVIVGVRHRRDLGDIASLAASIRDVGLLHPIVIRPDGVLIAGERRLEAYKTLGHNEIPVTEVDLDVVARGELAENVARKDFLPSEIDAIRRALEPAEKAAAKERMSEGGGDQRSADRVGKVSLPDTSRTRDKIGAFAGVSGRTVEKIAAIVAAAEADPERFGKLAADMDRTGRVNGPFRRLKVARQAEARSRRPCPETGPIASSSSTRPGPLRSTTKTHRTAPSIRTRPCRLRRLLRCALPTSRTSIVFSGSGPPIFTCARRSPSPRAGALSTKRS